MSKEENRKNMPLCTAFIDAMRQEFPDLQVTYAKENGVELGQRPETGCRDFVINASKTDAKGPRSDSSKRNNL